MINIGVIGIGRIVREGHLIALDQLSNRANFVALCNKNNIKSGKKIAEKYRVKHYCDYREMIKNEDIDLIIIASHAISHFEIALHCIENEKHLLIEKPLTISSKQAKILLSKSLDNNVHVFSCFQRRFNPYIRVVKNKLKNNTIGKILYVNCENIHNKQASYYVKKDNARLDGGGVLLNQALHSIDLLYFLFGMPLSINGHIDTLIHNINYEDTALLNFTMKENVYVNFFATTCSGIEEKYSIKIYGTSGSICIKPDYYSMTYIDENSNLNKYEKKYGIKNSDLLKFQLDSICKKLEDRRGNYIDNLCSIEDSLAGIRIVEYAYKLRKERLMVHGL